VSLVGAVLGVWANGDRAERQRRRDLHARALEAALAYGEMPFMIRRRRWEEDAQSGERVRLSDRFSAIQAEISACQVLLTADGDEHVSGAYERLISIARSTAGAAAHDAWTEPAVKHDEEMNIGPLFGRLEDFRREVSKFERVLSGATLPRRRQLVRWFRGVGRA
jgi:hypothetical protein